MSNTIAGVDARSATLLDPYSPQFVTYDLEFIDDGETIDLVSIAMVSGDGRELYAINREMDVQKILANEWLRKNVWPHLPLRDLPEKRNGYLVQKCSCRPVDPNVPSSRLEYACTHMNGQLNRDHPDVRTQGQIRYMVGDFLRKAHPESVDIQRDNIRMWAYYGAYDHVALAQIFGPMVNLPSHVPMITHDLKSEAMRLGSPEMPQQSVNEHNALADARHNLKVARFLFELATGTEKKEK